MRPVRPWLNPALHQLNAVFRGALKQSVVIFVAAALILATVWDARAIRQDQSRAEQARRDTAQQAALAQSKKASGGTRATGLDSVSAGQPQAPSQPAATDNPAPTLMPIKYSTSPDPRSTDYSYTPPAPNQADFATLITHSGQVAPGTLIGYNAEKYGMHAYYGGDLQFSVPSVSISESLGSASVPFTVTVPDGVPSRAPSMPWNDSSSTVFPAYSTALSDNATSWTMFIQLSGSPAPSATPYTVHIQTFRTNSGNDSWEYDGFLQVYVTS